MAPSAPTRPPERQPLVVLLHESSLDTPAFRAAAALISDQTDAVERWLESLARAAARFSHDAAALDDPLATFVARLAPPGPDGAVPPPGGWHQQHQQ